MAMKLHDAKKRNHIENIIAIMIYEFVVFSHLSHCLSGESKQVYEKGQEKEPPCQDSKP
jgi:hypothetical protein